MKKTKINILQGLDLAKRVKLGMGRSKIRKSYKSKLRQIKDFIGETIDHNVF